MKKIPQKTLDALLTIIRKYWKTGDTELLVCKTALAEQLQSETGIGWLAFCDFANSIFQYHGLKPNASNKTIYEALAVLGVEVVTDAEVQESESL